VKSHALQKIIIASLLGALTVTCAFLGYHLHDNYKEDKRLKTDYFTVNQIKYGLLSGSNWASQLNTVLAARIDSFKVTGADKAVLRAQVADILNRMIDEANEMLHRKREAVGDRIKFALINAFFDVEDLRGEVPKFSRAIVDQLEQSRHRDKLKAMVKNKVSHFLDATNQDSTGIKARMLSIYKMPSLDAFNRYVTNRTDEIRVHQRGLGFIMAGTLALILLTWLYILRVRELYAMSFMISVAASFTALYIGVSLPMIEIDARISQLELKLLGSQIHFYDQVIFYQAKSILDVIHILITHGQGDTILVGILILTFSVLFPVTKLICTTIYLFRGDRNVSRSQMIASD
jgi:hypothetical protein